MTPELEQWAREVGVDICSSHNTAHAHFWLSAFAKLVREEAWETCEKRHHPAIHIRPCIVCIEGAFTTICERFGLEGK